MRPRRGGGTEAIVRLALAPRALGRVLASPETESALASLVADASTEDESPPDERTFVVGVELACAEARERATHPYRLPADAATRPPPELSIVERVREVIAGYFDAQAAPPAVDVSGFADEVVIEVDVDRTLYSQLEPRLRDAARRVTPNVLLHRRR